VKVAPRPVFVSLLLALLTFAVYLPVCRYDFVNYDDSDYVTANSHVLGGLDWKGVSWAFTTGHASNWHPLTWLSHMLDCQLFGQRPGSQHLVSLAFHIANTVLLFLVLAQLTRAPARCAIVAALFALHPLHVESVAWISERKDVLSAFFFLLTLWAYGRYATQFRSPDSRSAPVKDRPRTEERAKQSLHSGIWYALAMTFCTFGLMSKPMLVTLPFVLLLLDYWPLQRLQSNAERSNLKPLALLLREKIPFFALSLASSLVTFIVQRKGGAVSTSISIGARAANALVSYMRYLGKTFWPAKLSVLYPHPGHWSTAQVLLCTAALVLISAAVIALARARPWLAVGWFWFLGMMVPVIGLIQVGIQSMADRYTYLPLIGIFIIVVWSIAEILGAGLGQEKTLDVASLSLTQSPFALAALPLGILAISACAALTRFQVQHWRNSETLFRHAVQVTKNNYLAYNNLGFFLSSQGKIDEAMENYRKSIEIEPNYEDAQNNLGYALASQKKYPEAIEHYNAALRVKPNHIEVHNNLGNALAEIGRTDEAIAHYLIVLKQKPDHADAHNNLGIALAMQGKLPEAVPHFQDAIRFKPGYASAHGNLGNAFAAQHRFDEAIKEYEECLRLKGDDAQAHNNLANVLVEQGRVVEAISHYTEALRLNADNPEAHYNLGLALARQGKQGEARAHYNEALRLRPDYAEPRRQLNSLPAEPNH